MYLLVYEQSDAYQATGCYNLLCAGFVQTNSRIAIGAAISPVSSVEGNQYDVTILIWKVPSTFPCFLLKFNLPFYVLSTYTIFTP